MAQQQPSVFKTYYPLPSDTRPEESIRVQGHVNTLMATRRADFGTDSRCT